MMKKLILIAAVISGINGLAFATDGAAHSSGANRFVANLNLDEVRAVQVEEILNSYKQIKNLAMSGDFEQIPVFIRDKEIELEQVLTEEEMTQFKQNVGQWAQGKDFSKYKKFAGKYFEKAH
ncbi:hypothetical protein [Paraglaciecola hydrolytica]|nr:hypothetical protein [Paraglaciecola hydrolytica]